MFYYMTDEKWAAMSKAEQDAMIRAETDAIITQCEMIQCGMAVRHAGLIYCLPLCHDWHDNHI